MYRVHSNSRIKRRTSKYCYHKKREKRTHVTRITFNLRLNRAQKYFKGGRGLDVVVAAKT